MKSRQKQKNAQQIFQLFMLNIIDNARRLKGKTGMLRGGEIDIKCVFHWVFAPLGTL